VVARRPWWQRGHARIALGRGRPGRAGGVAVLARDLGDRVLAATANGAARL